MTRHRDRPGKGEARAAARIHSHPDAGAAGSPQPRARAVRSRRAAGLDLEAAGQRRAYRARRQEQSRPARAWRVQWLRIGTARDSRAAGHRQGGDHHRVPLRRRVRRPNRHAVSRTESPDAIASARCGRDRRRRGAVWDRGGAGAQHHRARAGAGLRRTLSGWRRASQPR